MSRRSANQARLARVRGRQLQARAERAAFADSRSRGRRRASRRRGRRARTRVHRPSTPVVVLLLVLAGCGLAALGAVQADPDDATDLGMVSELGWVWWVGLAAVVAGIVVSLTRLGAAVGQTAPIAWTGLVLVLYGSPLLLTGMSRLEATYRHLGIIDQVQSTGFADRSIDAYFSWPGFFALWAMIGDTAGVPRDAMFVVAAVAPVAAILLFAPAMLLILRHLTDDVRLRWLAMTLFVALNWPGQDYFAPQTFAILVYLSVVGLVLEYAGRRDPSVARQRRMIAVVVVLGMVGIACSHQLTPFMLLVTLGALLVVRRLSSWWWLLPFSFALTVFWLVVPAWPYLEGHVAALFSEVGDAQAAAQSNFLDRLVAGTPNHKIVTTARLGTAAVIWTIGAVGVLTLWRDRRRMALPAALFAAPFLLLPMQAYGGELLIRVYYFGLLSTCLAVALALAWLLRDGRWHRVRVAVLTIVLVAVCGSTVLTRYGNEAGEGFTRDEVQAYAGIYDREDEHGVSLIALTHNTPWRFSDYAAVHHVEMEHAEPGPPWTEPLTAAAVVSKAEEEQRTHGAVYVVWTHSQSAMAELAANTTRGQVESVLDELTADPRFVTLSSTSRARVLLFRSS